MKYSIIVPVYNRPDEVDELLQSLTQQTFRDMEVIIVEDGSSLPCEDVVHRYAGKLPLRYYKKENSGPGQTRNYGAERSQGEYLIFLDSDCVLPSGFLSGILQLLLYFLLDQADDLIPAAVHRTAGCPYMAAAAEGSRYIRNVHSVPGP